MLLTAAGHRTLTALAPMAVALPGAAVRPMEEPVGLGTVDPKLLPMAAPATMHGTAVPRHPMSAAWTTAHGHSMVDPHPVAMPLPRHLQPVPTVAATTAAAAEMPGDLRPLPPRAQLRLGHLQTMHLPPAGVSQVLVRQLLRPMLSHQHLRHRRRHLQRPHRVDSLILLLRPLPLEAS